MKHYLEIAGRSRIPKPVVGFASPVGADGGAAATASRIPGSPAPSSSSSATRIPGLMAAPPAAAEMDAPPALAEVGACLARQCAADQLVLHACRTGAHFCLHPLLSRRAISLCGQLLGQMLRSRRSTSLCGRMRQMETLCSRSGRHQSTQHRPRDGAGALQRNHRRSRQLVQAVIPAQLCASAAVEQHQKISGWLILHPSSAGTASCASTAQASAGLQRQLPASGAGTAVMGVVRQMSGWRVSLLHQPH